MENSNHFEQPENKEKYTSRIKLVFLRHGKKEPDDPQKPDTKIQLTAEGRAQGMAKSKPETNIRQAVAFGSPRDRAQHIAALAMAGKQAEITGDETLEELKEKLNQEFKIKNQSRTGKNMSKVGIDPRLDLNLDEKTELGAAANDHYIQGDYLKFLVEESDVLAKKIGDKNNTTYSGGAANIASVIDKYLGIAKNWDKLVKDKQKEYTDTMERFLGTHAGISETFLAKLIDKTKGAEERKKFVQALDNQSFGYAEGFEAEILNQDQQEPVVRVTYKKLDKDGQSIFDFNETVGREIIKEIIAEG